MISNVVLPPPVFLPTSLNLPVIYIYWFLVLTQFSLTNYVYWVRFQSNLESRIQQGYLAFVIISQITYWVLAGPFFFYANKYPYGTKDRNNKICVGLISYFVLADAPLWLLDVRIVYSYGWINVIQGICFVLRTVSFMIHSHVVWFIYLWKATKYVHQQSQEGSTMYRTAQMQS
eukprot:PhF_6_TR4770/c0_g1_i1/m.6581